MKARVAIFASVVLCGNAMAESAQYAVDGLPVGAKLNFDSASYREFKCTPSEQFDGLTWCQKTRTEIGRRGPYAAGYSILHSGEGNVFYVNRSQEASFFNQAEVQADINRYSRSIGQSPQIMKMPHRNGLPDGMIATWGGLTLKPLDPQSARILAEGKSPKKGLLIDFLGDLTRSAKEGLPVYRIEGGPGFVWAASFGLRTRGTLRVVAADTTGFNVPASEQQATAESTTIVAAAGTNPVEAAPSIDTLQSEITNLNGRIADLETAAETARGEAARARAAAEQTAATGKAQLEATIAQLQADRAAADAKAGWWQKASLGAIGGLLVVLTGSAIGFFTNRRKASVANQPAAQPAAEPIGLPAQSQSAARPSGLSAQSQNGAQAVSVSAQAQTATQPIELPAQSQNGAQEFVPHVASPEIAAAVAAVGVALEEQVNATSASAPAAVSTPAGEKLNGGAEVSAPRS